MTDQRYTPGPWRITEGLSNRRVYVPGDKLEIVTDTGSVVCTLYKTNFGHGRDEFHASLLKTAPALLSELKTMVERFKRCLLQTGSAGDEEIAESAVANARKIIAEAEHRDA